MHKLTIDLQVHPLHNIMVVPVDNSHLVDFPVCSSGLLDLRMTSLGHSAYSTIGASVS